MNRCDETREREFVVAVVVRPGRSAWDVIRDVRKQIDEILERWGKRADNVWALSMLDIHHGGHFLPTIQVRYGAQELTQRQWAARYGCGRTKARFIEEAV